MITNFRKPGRWSVLAAVLIASLTVAGLTDARGGDLTNSPSSSASASGTGCRLSVDLCDGSRVIGTSPDDSLRFHSPLLGDLNVSLANIRSIEFASAGETARLTAINGDGFTVQFIATGLRMETSFGKIELPVKLIRNVRVSAMPGAGQFPSGLVGLWSGEGNGNDSVGDNTGTLTNVTFAEGKVGQAFSFNGTNSGIKIPASPALDVGTGDGFTVMAWVNPSNLAEQQRGQILEWSNGGQTTPWGVHLLMLGPYQAGLGAGNLVGNVHDTDGQEHLIMAPGGTLAANIFQHVAMTYDKTSGVSRLFRNGTVVAEQNIGHITPQTSYDFYIGRRPSGDVTCSFAGLIDEVGVYNRALSASEIQAICAKQNNGKLPPPAPMPDVTPVNGVSRHGGGEIDDRQ